MEMFQGKPIYLDYNATTPIDPRVAEAMLPYLLEHFGNPSSSHVYGRRAKEAVDKARGQVAGMLGCREEEIVFTSGGSESNNYAVKGIARALRSRGRHLVASTVEHPAVTEVCRHLEEEGFRTTLVPVDGNGRVDPRDVEAAITPETILISIMHANNEVGTIQPVEEISRIAHSRGILVHSDAAQSVGKIPVRVDELEVDLLSVAGHKLYAPKGIGALFVRSGVQPDKLIDGANHEMNRRAGTENVAQIVGLGEACAMVRENQSSYEAHLRRMRNRLEEGIAAGLSEVRVHGHPRERIPNTSSVGFRGLSATQILSELRTVAASAGAACHSDHVSVSGVLQAMQVPLEYAMGTIRFSVGRFTSADEVDTAVREIAAVVGRIRQGR